MTSQVEFAKDVSLGVLSVSAILLTLVFGFISPSIPKSQDLRITLLLAGFGLYGAVGMSAICLVWLTSVMRTKGRKLEHAFWLWYFAQFIGLMIGLVGVVSGIVANLAIR